MNNFKKTLLITAMIIIPSFTFADTNNTDVKIPVTATTTVDARTITNSTGGGTDLSKSVGTAVAPSLTSSFSEVCMGSTSMGAGFAGGSLSIGTTWENEDCQRRLDAREIKNLGDLQASKEIMCESERVREAFKRVGRPCVADGGTYVSATPTPPAPVSINEESKRRQEQLLEEAVARQAEQNRR